MAAVSRKIFVRTAAVLAGEWASQPKHRAAVRAITLSIADVFTQESGNFDREKFYTAVWGSPTAHPEIPCRECGLTETKTCGLPCYDRKPHVFA